MSISAAAAAVLVRGEAAVKEEHEYGNGDKILVGVCEKCQVHDCCSQLLGLQSRVCSKLQDTHAEDIFILLNNFSPMMMVVKMRTADLLISSHCSAADTEALLHQR